MVNINKLLKRPLLKIVRVSALVTGEIKIKQEVVYHANLGVHKAHTSIVLKKWGNCLEGKIATSAETPIMNQQFGAIRWTLT